MVRCGWLIVTDTSLDVQTVTDCMHSHIAHLARYVLSMSDVPLKPANMFEM